MVGVLLRGPGPQRQLDAILAIRYPEEVQAWSHTRVDVAIMDDRCSEFFLNLDVRGRTVTFAASTRALENVACPAAVPPAPVLHPVTLPPLEPGTYVLEADGLEDTLFATLEPASPTTVRLVAHASLCSPQSGYECETLWWPGGETARLLEPFPLEAIGACVFGVAHASFVGPGPCGAQDLPTVRLRRWKP